jgi:hypothetical protein
LKFGSDSQRETGKVVGRDRKNGVGRCTVSTNRRNDGASVVAVHHGSPARGCRFYANGRNPAEHALQCSIDRISHGMAFSA